MREDFWEGGTAGCGGVAPGSGWGIDDCERRWALWAEDGIGFVTGVCHADSGETGLRRALNIAVAVWEPTSGPLWAGDRAARSFWLYFAPTIYTCLSDKHYRRQRLCLVRTNLQRLMKILSNNGQDSPFESDTALVCGHWSIHG